jgi:hypothetical protein
MTEWLKVPLSKSGVPATVPRVRIPLSPPRKSDDSLPSFFLAEVNMPENPLLEL